MLFTQHTEALQAKSLSHEVFPCIFTMAALPALHMRVSIVNRFEYVHAGTRLQRMTDTALRAFGGWHLCMLVRSTLDLTV